MIMEIPFYLTLYQAFFFSSRRQHTSYWRDWSSEVCSSDLPTPDMDALDHDAPRADEGVVLDHDRDRLQRLEDPADPDASGEVDVRADLRARADRRPRVDHRSEERRVGKEWRSRRSTDSETK